MTSAIVVGPICTRVRLLRRRKKTAGGYNSSTIGKGSPQILTVEPLSCWPVNSGTPKLLTWTVGHLSCWPVNSGTPQWGLLELEEPVHSCHLSVCPSTMLIQPLNWGHPQYIGSGPKWVHIEGKSPHWGEVQNGSTLKISIMHMFNIHCLLSLISFSSSFPLSLQEACGWLSNHAVLSVMYYRPHLPTYYVLRIVLYKIVLYNVTMATRSSLIKSLLV